MARRTHLRPLVLSRYVPATDTWQRVGSYPNRKAATSAAYGADQR